MELMVPDIEANSFYKGKGIKHLVPYFYQVNLAKIALA
jgi:hypothetical protein